MAKLTGIFRLGRDAEIRTLPSGEAVVNLALAYNYGKKGEDGNRPTQWIDASFWGERAVKIAPYLLKGNQIGAFLSDIHIETYEGRNGAGHKLAGRVDDIELTDRKDGQQQAAPAQRQAPAAAPARNSYADARGAPQPQRQAPPNRNDSGFDDMADDIPF